MEAGQKGKSYMDRKFFRQPALTIEQIVEFTRTPASTMRTWVQRGKVELQGASLPAKPGRGLRAHYTPSDALQFALLGELAALGLRPDLLDARTISDVRSVALDVLDRLSDGKPLPERRFLCFYKRDDMLVWGDVVSVQNYLELINQETGVCAATVLDLHSFAKRLMVLYRTMQDSFG